ncbi:MAG: hypothetical protein LBV20_05700 [Treponema sp.]|jgi:hypothetical protein|nr:hypothetical protein [Treponema sp.]
MRTKRQSLCFIFILMFSLFSLVPLFAKDVLVKSIPNDAEFRIAIKDTWLTEVPDRTLRQKPGLFKLPDGTLIQVRAESVGQELMVILARERLGDYPGWIQGSWIVNRSMQDGKIVRIRIFLRSDPYTYIQFRPLTEDRSELDVVLYDGFAVRSLPVPLPLERIMYMSLNDVLATLGDKFPRKYFDPLIDLYADTRSFVSSVRKRLPELIFRDDGAIDEDGRYVLIETLEPQTGEAQGVNCSGFAKWIVDGLLRPLTGTQLTIPPLKAPFGDRGSSFTAPYEDLRDPFFGLDWSRNLAAATWSVLRSPSFANLDEIEVRDQNLSTVIMRNGRTSSLRSYPGFLRNAGYGIEGLHPLLYMLAINEPGHIYLAAVNDEQGTNPPLRQFFHIAVLVPYFNEYGDFQVACFESAEETSFNAFKTRYPGGYVNLSRLPVEANFDPQKAIRGRLDIENLLRR